MPDTVFQTTGPHGVVLYGQPWAYNQSAALPDGRKFTGRLEAVATNYGEITLNWTLPLLADQIDRFAVVRASYGAPRSRYTGYTVIEAASSGPVRTIADGTLTSSQWYYYSLYVRETSTGRWILSATSSQISVRNWGHHKEMLNSLPTFYLNLDRTLGNSVEAAGPLYRFLQLFAFELDLERTLAKNVEQSRSMPDVGAQMLPSYAKDFGLNYEVVFGDAKMRGVLDRIMKWRKDKGDTETLTEIVRTLSACSDGFVETVPNILLDHNDSGFDEPTLGRWMPVTNAILTRQTTSPVPRSSGGYLRVEADLAGDVKAASSSVASVKSHGIKVEPNTVYCASAYTRAATTTRSISLGIEWYDKTGTLITSFHEPGGIDTLGPFGERPFGHIWWQGPHGPAPYGSGSGDDSLVNGIVNAVTNSNANWDARPYTVQQAPIDARWARVTLNVPGCADNERHLFDEIQFEEGELPSDYRPARMVRVSACGDRKNVIRNPSFEVDARGWAGVNTLLTVNEDPDQAIYGNGLLVVTPIAAGPVSVTTTAAVNESKYYTFSANLFPFDNPTTTVLTIEWMDDDSHVLRVNSIESELTAGYWNRPSVTAVGPDGATKAAFSVVTFPLPGESIGIDGVLAEAGTSLQDYFDGSFGGDWQWAGEDNYSQSIFIANRDVFTEVLGRYLDEFVPATTPWEIVYTA